MSSDPDELLEHLVEQSRSATEARDLARLELYHRCSTGLRVELDSTTGGSVHWTDDDGIAVRAVSRGSKAVRFGAATGSSPEVVQWLVDRALPSGSAADWPRLPPAELADHDSAALPAAGEVEGWLRSAWSELCATAGGPSRWVEGLARVDVARTIESWVSDGGLSASRTRTRAWAVARTRRGKAAPMLRRPLVVASRSWRHLQRGGWAELWNARAAGPRIDLPASRPLRLDPEPSGELVAALARMLHGPGAPVGEKVGPGWGLEDDPLGEDALYGGTFDDSGFPTAARLLADGRSIVGSIAGPGHYRRGSFRDPPLPRHAALVLRTLPVAPPPRAVRISSLVLHPRGPDDWTLEVAGPELAHGLIRLAPLDLVRRCVGTTGERRTDHRGVSTPSLIFEEVEIRPFQA